MRARPVVTALVVLAAGLTARAALRKLATRRRGPVVRTLAADALVVAPGPVEVTPEREAVVLAFTPRTAVAPVAEKPAAPVRCGDTGGVTKAGAPCGARGLVAGRCHHHRVAA